MTVLSIIQRELALVCGVSADSVQPEARLISFGLDSVRMMDLIIGLEAEFDIDIPDADISQLETVADVISLVKEKVERKTAV